MTNEELAIKIKQGNLDLLPTLWEQIERLVYVYANRYFTLYSGAFAKAGIEIEDLIQEAYFAVLDAVKVYDPESGYRFTTYLKYPLRNHFNEILGFRHKRIQNNPLYHAVSLEKPTQGAENLTVGDGIPDAVAELEMESVLEREYQRKLQQDLRESVDTLPEEQQAIISMRYYDGNTFQVIADELEIGSSAVRSLEHKALRTLRWDKRLREYREEIMSRAYRGSFSSWLNTGTSSTERAAVMLSDWDSFVDRVGRW